MYICIHARIFALNPKKRKTMNYNKLMSLEPYVLGELKNSIGQVITFVEHPTRGDEYPVICVCNELQLAEKSDFYEIDDMIATHKEYEPLFIDGKLQIGL